MSLLNSIICPITHQIFYNPVTIDDGYTYEKQAIEKWLENNKTSPMTKDKITIINFKVNIVIKNIIENYLLENPDKKEEQFKEYIVKNNFVWDNFKNLTIIKQKEYLDNCIDLEQYNDGFKPIHFICKYSTPEMIKYIIDKNVDLECKINNGWKPIHFICRYQTSDIISYAFTKFDTTKKCLIYDGIPVNCSVYNLIDLNPYITNKLLLKFKLLFLKIEF